MEEMKHGKIYVCKRLRMLSYLIKKGYKPIQIVPDINNPTYNVYVFENSVEFEKDVDQYFLSLKINKEK